MAFEIAHAESFPLELGRAPKKVRNAYYRRIVPLLRSSPDVADPPRIKRLAGYRDLWRLRVSDDYRLVYRLDLHHRLVIMLMIDHRSRIYDRLRAGSDRASPTRIVGPAEKFVEAEPPRPSADPIREQPTDAAVPSPSPAERLLPELLTADLLSSWHVPTRYHRVFAPVRTERDLLSLCGRVPDDVLERVLDGLWPAPIDDVLQRPVRVPAQPEDVEAAATGVRRLRDFLLKLDEDQQRFVSRFQQGEFRGPWLVKGAPGTGKSILALYCARAVLEHHRRQPSLWSKPPRVLLTTFSKALAAASSELLRSLIEPDLRPLVDVINVDALAPQFLPPEWRRKGVVTFSDRRVKELLRNTIVQLQKEDRAFAFNSSDTAFLIEEFDWIIAGQGMTSVREYLAADRSGRGRRLTESQRKQVWEVYERVVNGLRQQNLCTLTERLAEASENAQPRYDFVIVDEVQDLKPVAIRLCLALCRDPRRVVLTVDPNQTIYGTGMSWASLSETLRFRGRTRIFRRSYRSTREIWRAIQQVIRPSEGADPDTLNVEPVTSGPRPTVVFYRKRAQKQERLNAFLYEGIRHERITPGGAAVLCPTKKVADEAIALLDRSLKPKMMRSGSVNLSHPGVKVMTMHSAKGLQFPVVAIVGMEAGAMPWPAAAGTDRDEHEARQQRLFFVACSRAMRKLLILGSHYNPSPFLASLTEDYWQIERL